MLPLFRKSSNLFKELSRELSMEEVVDFSTQIYDKDSGLVQ